MLYAPDYGHAGKTEEHRTYETIAPLAQLLGLTIATPVAEGREAALIEAILAGSGTALVCWEHHHMPAIAGAIPCTTAVPTAWPDNRFDLIWAFTKSDSGAAAYTFAQLPQRLLAGDLGA